MKNGFAITETFPAKASEIYEAWLNSEGHSRMTGSAAQVDGRAGGKFTAWDGYIFGTTLELTLNQRIVQSWRTSEFPDDAPDSRVEVIFEEYRQGWDDFYFKPMKSYFSK
jgi:activator of HSP90 ATPase